MNRAAAVPAGIVLVVAVASGQTGAPQGTVRNTIACESLAGTTIAASAIGLPTTGAFVAAATLVSASTQTVAADRVVLAVPEYCKVTGAIAPVDPTAPMINFHVNLPLAWNRKLAHVGGGGLNGVIPVSLTTDMHWEPAALPPNAPHALARGFVSYGSDSGHRRVPASGAAGAPPTPPSGPPPAEWQTNDEALTNFAYAQMKKTHDVTVGVVARFYGEPIRRSYFFGGSEGGREALMVAQRFPEDYDGVVSLDPVPAMTHHFISDWLARMKREAGDGWVPPAKVTALAKEVLRQCDALDGLEDGLVSYYAACNRKFDPAVIANPLAAIRCAGGADTGQTCLSDPQLRAASGQHAGATLPFPLANGWTTFPGWGTGGESPTNWRVFEAPPTALTGYAIVFWSRVVKDPTVKVPDVNLATYAKEVQQLSALLDATNPDLSKFRQRGGKLLLKVNTADYSTNPRWTMAYFERMVRTMGTSAVDEFMRFYVAIGLDHGDEGSRTLGTKVPVPRYVDYIAMLDDWVEQGRTPADTQVLSDMDPVPPFSVHATFPMCRYPMYPHYDGSGDPKVAGSYTCVRP